MGAALRALEVLDVGVVIHSPSLGEVVYRNAAAQALIGEITPNAVADAFRQYVHARKAGAIVPPSLRVELGRDREVYVRVVESSGDPRLEVAVIREGMLRQADAFRALNARYGLTRREWQIIGGLRVGRTNRQIGQELRLPEGTIARHMHRLLGRFKVANRTQLVDLIERFLATRG
jgi:DNA-binding NarL/FixJ family response regulator